MGIGWGQCLGDLFLVYCTVSCTHVLGVKANGAFSFKMQTSRQLNANI